MRFTRLAALVGTAVLALGSCATSADDTPAAAGDEPAAAAADLSFTADTLDGPAVDGEQFAGKPTVFWFWAPWCPTCRAQAPAVSDLALKYEGVVNVVGVGGLADEADIRDYADTVEGPLHLIDPEGEVWQHFGVTAQSTYLVLDEDGGVTADGYLDDPVLADRVAELVD